MLLSIYIAFLVYSTYRLMISVKHCIAWFKDKTSTYGELFFINITFLTNAMVFAMSIGFIIMKVK